MSARWTYYQSSLAARLPRTDRSQHRRRVARPDRQSPSDESSKHACFLEAELARACVCGRANDDVIEQFDLEKLRGFGPMPRQAVIGLAWRCIAAGMIVHDNHRLGSGRYR